MFRVLSEEEARKAVRWRAPELNQNTAQIANTRQVVSSLAQPENQDIEKLLARASLKTTMPQTHTSAPELQASHPIDASSVLSSKDTLEPEVSVSTTANIPLPNPSADMLQTSYDEGYALGRDEGQARGYAEGNAALHQETVVRLNGVIAALSQSKIASDDSALEQEVLALSLEIARVLLRREIAVQPEALSTLVKQGLQQLPSANDAMRRVRLHPLDAKITRDLLADTAKLEIVDDPDLAQGDCIVECASSVVHAGLDNWLENMASQLGILPKVEPDIEAQVAFDNDSGQIATP